MLPKYDFNSPGSPIADDQKIPSELIEGHLHRFFMIQLESLAFGMSTPAKVRNDLKGVKYFVGCSCGLHANIATNNIYFNLISMTDEQMIEVAKKTFK